MNTRIETWLGHEIRFIEVNPNDWWAVAVDICKALDLKQVTKALKGLPLPGVTTSKVGVVTGERRDGTISTQEVMINIIDSKNIYRLAFKSRKKEAIQFQDWVFDILETLRKSDGLEGFQIFRMLDKEHQREAMRQLKLNLTKPIKVDYIKANTVANKTVSTMFGYSRMLKKDAMTPEMLVQRQEVLNETVNLMGVNEKFNLDLSIGKTVRGKYLN
ncbi:MAG: Prophage antirepressor [candidate division WWE3 bacterium GW2011_GWF1_42_14]|uniref:Prophage antirepressor n=1 Tax=candidate division WWE3 bacterium GW2011_GWF1_42_14 TaxID=1619138 RepID=A0A0G0YHV9_UNCKA|nr:MAG: Prophage antirepressor [candidate division WWE3 bacterium GW2011_GWF1_42_14]